MRLPAVSEDTALHDSLLTVSPTAATFSTRPTITTVIGDFGVPEIEKIYGHFVFMAF